MNIRGKKPKEIIDEVNILLNKFEKGHYSIYAFTEALCDKIGEWSRRDERERVEKALEDSKKFLKALPKPFNMEGKAYFTLNDIKTSILALAVHNEVCTLKWVLKMKGSKMNCYSEELNKESSPK